MCTWLSATSAAYSLSCATPYVGQCWSNPSSSMIVPGQSRSQVLSSCGARLAHAASASRVSAMVTIGAGAANLHARHLDGASPNASEHQAHDEDTGNDAQPADDPLLTLPGPGRSRQVHQPHQLAGQSRRHLWRE